MDKQKGLLIRVGITALILSLLVGGAILLKQNIKDDSGSTTKRQGDVVAKVNGEEINSEEIVAAQEVIGQQGQEVSEERALEQVINQKLVSQKVESEGYSVSTEEAEATIEQQLSAQGMTLEDYKQQVEEQGVSYQDQLNKISEELAVQNYISGNIDQESIEVTDEETEQFYQEYQNQDTEQEIPSYEEIKPQIIAMLEQQKQQELVSSFLKELRQEAEIEYL